MKAKFPKGQRVRVVCINPCVLHGGVAINDLGVTLEEDDVPYVKFDRQEVGVNGVWAMEQSELEAVEEEKTGGE